MHIDDRFERRRQRAHVHEWRLYDTVPYRDGVEKRYDCACGAWGYRNPDGAWHSTMRPIVVVKPRGWHAMTFDQQYDAVLGAGGFNRKPDAQGWHRPTADKNLPRLPKNWRK